MSCRIIKWMAISCFLFLPVSCTKDNNIQKAEVFTGDVEEYTANWALISGNRVKLPGVSAEAIGVAWDTAPNPVATYQYASGQQNHDTFSSKITGLTGNTTYYARAFATNDAGTAYGNQITFATPSPDQKPLVETREPGQINADSATLKGEVIKHGGTEVARRGFIWSDHEDLDNHGTFVYADAGIGLFSVSLNVLVSESVYYYKAFAENDSGMAYGQKREFHTLSDDACLGISAPAGFGIIAFDNKCWLDRNLGASRVATTLDDESAFGGLYQWGREADGHQHPTSVTTSTLAPPGAQPNHNQFIVKYAYPFDWNEDNTWDNRWTLPNGNITTADPCPNGWRVPTRSEWESAIAYGNWQNAYDPFNSPLRLPAAGKRDDKGVLGHQGTKGYYWSSSHQNIFGVPMNSFHNGVFLSSYYRVGGMSVRCIKND